MYAMSGWIYFYLKVKSFFFIILLLNVCSSFVNIYICIFMICVIIDQHDQRPANMCYEVAFCNPKITRDFFKENCLRNYTNCFVRVFLYNMINRFRQVLLFVLKKSMYLKKFAQHDSLSLLHDDNKQKLTWCFLRYRYIRVLFIKSMNLMINVPGTSHITSAKYYSIFSQICN